MAETTAQVTEHMNADAERVYGMVSDLPRMGEWSPENSGGKWLGGASGPTVGAKFKGSNRKGFRRWSTTCEVTTAEPGRRFSFHVRYGPVSIADWSYEIERDDSGVRVTESWVDRRPGWMDRLSRPVMGVADRAAHNHDGMQQTLAAIKRAAESQ